MVKEPPPVTDKEYPKLTENNNTKQHENTKNNDIEKNPTSTSQIKIIPETQLEQNQQEELEIIPQTPLDQMPQEQIQIEFLSPSLVTDKFQTQDNAPQSLNVSTPNTNSDIDERLELHQIKIVP